VDGLGQRLKHVMVVCPKAVAQNWRSEIENWSFLKVVHVLSYCTGMSLLREVPLTPVPYVHRFCVFTWGRALQVEVLAANDRDGLYRVVTARNFDVLLATYDQLKLVMDKACILLHAHITAKKNPISEWLTNDDHQLRGTPQIVDLESADSRSVRLENINTIPWEFVVFDEAHELKKTANSNYKTLNKLECMVRYKWKYAKPPTNNSIGVRGHAAKLTVASPQPSDLALRERLCRMELGSITRWLSSWFRVALATFRFVYTVLRTIVMKQQCAT
jgi:SNF2 family DNA or RNA helicase